MASPKGAKPEMVEAVIESMTNFLTVSELERACPRVSSDMVGRVLRGLKEEGEETWGGCRGRSGRNGVVPLKRGNKEGDVARLRAVISDKLVSAGSVDEETYRPTSERTRRLKASDVRNREWLTAEDSSPNLSEPARLGFDNSIEG